ncbi:hypothetical protein D3C87_2034650 [compost metagenome]
MRAGSPTPAMTAATSEWTGLMEATTLGAAIAVVVRSAVVSRAKGASSFIAAS